MTVSIFALFTHRLLVLDILDYQASSWQGREQRMAGAGVAVERTKLALDACLDHGLLQGDEDDLSLARATRDAFKVMESCAINAVNRRARRVGPRPRPIPFRVDAVNRTGGPHTGARTN
ncbi:MAG: hypothetical protein IT462_14395 [Planctomycetes bacterium]|nr:hypothetical protein [Planctomycetota bacterium]